jgi:hypothetical protein
MQSENTRRIIRNVAVVGGIVLVVVAIFLIIRALFFMPPATQTQLTNPLLDTSTNRGVKMTVRGPIIATENARSYDVDVTPSSRSVTLYSGYDGTVISKQVYDNSPAAYEQFVYALNKADMTRTRQTSDSDTRGVCATGNLYTFSLENDTTIESSLWTSSCRSERGTLNTAPLPLNQLFDTQIPDIAKYRAGL